MGNFYPFICNEWASYFPCRLWKCSRISYIVFDRAITFVLVLKWHWQITFQYTYIRKDATHLTRWSGILLKPNYMGNFNVHNEFWNCNCDNCMHCLTYDVSINLSSFTVHPPPPSCTFHHPPTHSSTRTWHTCLAVVWFTCKAFHPTLYSTDHSTPPLSCYGNWVLPGWPTRLFPFIPSAHLP